MQGARGRPALCSLFVTNVSCFAGSTRWRDLQEVFIKAGIIDGHSHRFRDTAAVELLKAGADIREV